MNKKPVTAATLEPELRALLPANAPPDSQPTVVLRVDSGLNVQKLMDILENWQSLENEDGNGHAVGEIVKS